MRVVLENIQSINKAVYDMPDTGLVKICGGNSNGKSVLIKAIGAVVSMDILNAESRRALINDKCNSGYIQIDYKGKSLCIELNVERNSCAVGLIRGDGSKVIRTFREGGIEELIYEFGFRVYNKNNICLQVHETFGTMPFVNTSKLVNGEIVENVTEDAIAKDFLTKYKEVSHKEAKDLIAKINSKIAQWESTKRALTVFDYGAYEQMSERLNNLILLVDSLSALHVEEIKTPECIDVLKVPELNLHKLQIPMQVELLDIPKLEVSEMNLKSLENTPGAVRDIAKVLEDYMTMRQGVCPTCGHAFKEDIDG